MKRIKTRFDKSCFKKFKTTGMKHLALEITKHGFVIWDTISAQWVLDGSCLLDDGCIKFSKSKKAQDCNSNTRMFIKKYADELGHHEISFKSKKTICK